MNIEKAKQIADITNELSAAKSLVKDLITERNKSLVGLVSVTIPRDYLPLLISTTQAEIDRLTKQIEEL